MQVYILVDNDNYDIYYVGYSKDYLRRFNEHLYRWNIITIIQKGIVLVPYVVNIIDTIELAREYETRWIFHSIQTRQPIINAETEDSSLVECVYNCNINFLNLPNNVYAYNILKSRYPNIKFNHPYNTIINRTATYFKTK